MRDWLALPVNTNTGASPSSSKNSARGCSSDEGITTDEDEYRYDIIHKSASTEEELEVTECNHQGQDEELSAWLSVLRVFGVAKKIKSLASSSTSSSSLSVKKSRENVSRPELAALIDEAIEEESHNNKEKEESDKEEEEEEAAIVAASETEENENQHVEESVHLQRTFSSSSIASSTDTDNSTPASSEIMNSSSAPSKFYHEITMAKTTNVQIRWNHGGKKVQVTGEFDNWSVSVDMVQDTERPNCHVVDIPMDLSKDIEFKFIVDGEWRYANDLPHRTDWRGNINNVIYKKENFTATTSLGDE